MSQQIVSVSNIDDPSNHIVPAAAEIKASYRDCATAFATLLDDVRGKDENNVTFFPIHQYPFKLWFQKYFLGPHAEFKWKGGNKTNGLFVAKRTSTGFLIDTSRTTVELDPKDKGTISADSRRTYFCRTTKGGSNVVTRISDDIYFRKAFATNLIQMVQKDRSKYLAFLYTVLDVCFYDDDDSRAIKTLAPGKRVSDHVVDEVFASVNSSHANGVPLMAMDWDWLKRSSETSNLPERFVTVLCDQNHHICVAVDRNEPNVIQCFDGNKLEKTTVVVKPVTKSQVEHSTRSLAAFGTKLQLLGFWATSTAEELIRLQYNPCTAQINSCDSGILAICAAIRLKLLWNVEASLDCTNVRYAIEEFFLRRFFVDTDAKIEVEIFVGVPPTPTLERSVDIVDLSSNPRCIEESTQSPSIVVVPSKRPIEIQPETNSLNHNNTSSCLELSHKRQCSNQQEKENEVLGVVTPSSKLQNRKPLSSVPMSTLKESNENIPVKLPQQQVDASSRSNENTPVELPQEQVDVSSKSKSIAIKSPNFEINTNNELKSSAVEKKATKVEGAANDYRFVDIGQLQLFHTQLLDQVGFSCESCGGTVENHIKTERGMYFSLGFRCTKCKASQFDNLTLESSQTVQKINVRNDSKHKKHGSSSNSFQEPQTPGQKTRHINRMFAASLIATGSEYTKTSNFLKGLGTPVPSRKANRVMMERLQEKYNEYWRIDIDHLNLK